MSELTVGSLSGLAANSYVVDVAAGSTLDLSNATDLPASALPAGSILQVVSTTKTDTYTVNSGTFTDVTGLSVSITPTSATSKIFVTYDTNLGNAYGTNVAVIRLMRDSTPIFIGDSAGSRVPASGAGHNRSSNHMTEVSGSILDSPATTSATTYKIQLAWSSGGSIVSVNRSVTDSDAASIQRMASTITAMEVAA